MSLGPDAKSLLSAVGDAEDPTEDDAARVRAKLAGRLAVAASAGIAAGTVSKTATAGTSAAAGAAAGGGAALGSGLLATTGAKVVVALALVGGTGVGGAVALRATAAPSAPVQRPVSVASVAEAVAAPEVRSQPERTEPEPPVTVVAAVTVESLPSAPIAERRSPSRVTETNVVNPPSVAKPAEVAAPESPSPIASAKADPSPVASDSIAAEAKIIRSAQAALARGDGAAALAQLNDHATRFPNGSLSEERNAARVFALCASGRAAEARAAATAFVTASPRSPLAAQVRRSCSEKAEAVP